MPRIKGSTVKSFDFKKLNKNGKLDLLQYINPPTMIRHLPYSIYRIVSGLLETNKYKIEGTLLVLKICNMKTEETKVTETEEEVTETNEEKTEEDVIADANVVADEEEKEDEEDDD